MVSLQLLGLTPMDLHGGEGILPWTQKALDWLGPAPGLTSGPLVSIYTPPPTQHRHQVPTCPAHALHCQEPSSSFSSCGRVPSG